MSSSVSPDDAIDAIRGTGGARPGYRALHAKGILYRGTFTATAGAGRLSCAKHLDGSPVPALIRFSNGSGNPAQCAVSVSPRRRSLRRSRRCRRAR